MLYKRIIKMEAIVDKIILLSSQDGVNAKSKIKLLALELKGLLR